MVNPVPPEIQTAIQLTSTWLWSEYGKKVVEKTAGRVVDEARWRLGLENYYYSLYERVGFVHILGRMEAEPLENVFTDLNVLDRPLAERRYDIDRLETEFDPRDFGWQKRVRRVAGDEAVAEFDRLFILGKPGAGKTTFLKHTALRAIRGELQEVPVFVTLRELVDAGQGASSDDIFDFIVHKFEIHQLPNPEPFVRRLLEKGDAILLLDGLDEVNVQDNRRRDLINALNDFIYRYGACPTLLTCRVAATDYSFTQFEYVEMADFDREQMARYVERWFDYDEEKGRRCKRELLESPENEPIRELAQVPLLLSLLCLVYEERNEFPPNRHEIYEEATRALLVKWDAKRNISRDSVYGALTVRRREQMLAHLAAATFDDGLYFVPERRLVSLIESYLVGVPGLDDGEPVDGHRVLRTIEDQHGLLVERAHAVHSFSHLTLQEYFTAAYIVANERRGSVERLMRHVGEDRWHEVFLLVAGMLLDATEFFELFLARLEEMIGQDPQLVSLLEWAEAKRQDLPALYKPAATRAYLLSRAVDLADSLKSDPNRTPVLDLTRVLELIRPLELARALDMALARDLDLTRDLDLALDLVIARDLEVARVFDLAREVAEHTGNRDFGLALAGLEAPAEETDSETHEQFAQALEDILRQYGDIWHPKSRLPVTEAGLDDRWQLSREQTKTLTEYLALVHLLVRCLKLAYVPGRAEIEEGLLLPPGGAAETT